MEREATSPAEIDVGSGKPVGRQKQSAGASVTRRLCATTAVPLGGFIVFARQSGSSFVRTLNAYEFCMFRNPVPLSTCERESFGRIFFSFHSLILRSHAGLEPLLLNVFFFSRRHGGSLHGIIRRGSRHGSSRHGVKSYHRHNSAISLRAKSHPRQDRPSRGQEINNVSVGRDAPTPAKQKTITSVSSVAEGIAAERATSVANDPASPVVLKSGAAAVVVNDAPASGNKLDGQRGEHSEMLGGCASAGRPGDNGGEGGALAAGTSLDGAKSPSSVKPKGVGAWESPHSLENQASPVRPLTTPAVAAATARKGHTLVTELPSEAKPADFEADDVKGGSPSESGLAAGAKRPESRPASPTNEAGVFEAAAFGADPVTSGVGGKDAPTEDRTTPMGGEKAPTEEPAPTEERGRAGSPIGFSALERRREQQVKIVRLLRSTVLICLESRWSGLKISERWKGGKVGCRSS